MDKAHKDNIGRIGADIVNEVYEETGYNPNRLISTFPADGRCGQRSGLFNDFFQERASHDEIP